MKTIQIEIPEGKRAEWVDNMLTLVDEQPVEFKFELNDIVKSKRGYGKFSIYRREVVNGEPHYWLKDESGYPYPLCVESYIEPYTEPKDITERIKTFDDACQWCKENCIYNPAEHFIRGVKWCEEHPKWHCYPEEKPSVGNETDFVVWFIIQLKDGSVFPAIYEPMKLYRGNIGHKEGWRCLISGWVYDLDEAVAWMEMPKPIHIN